MASKKKVDESTAVPKAKSPRKPAAAGSKTAGAKAGKATEGKATEGKTTEKAAEAKVARAPRAASAPAAAGLVPAGKPTGKVVVERQIGGRTLSLETGRMAKLSDSAVIARYGDTMVLATVNNAKAMDGIDFFPLTVDYREKTSAAGVIPGGFFKREGRPSTKEILCCRLIDRSIRPMFPDGFKREVQVLSQVLSTDRENDPDVIAAIASFAALAISSLPHGRSLGMVRIGMKDDKLQVNPLWSTLQSPDNKLNLTVAGHDEAIMMVEAGAKEVTEEVMIQALELAHSVVREVAGMIDELVAKAGKPKMVYTPPVPDEKLVAAIEAQFGKLLREAPIMVGTKQVRSAAIKVAKEKACSAFPAPAGLSESQVKAYNANLAEIVGDIVKDGERQSVLRGTRADGRDHTTVRPITIEVGVLPRVHGSVLFTRGETQALGVVTLGSTDDQQIVDGLMPEPRKRFLLHYNFPPFSVGEVKRVGTPGRREIGHGALAERGLDPVLPAREDFPYTIRFTSEILESNGSSSMATACAGTLAMMDAGIKIKQPVAGIAMGLVMEGKKYAILTDILGSEDACGDMDFKVVGTGRGITALQMDIKCEGLTRAIMAEALEQARQGRLHVLREMLKALAKPRADLSPNAPRLESVKVPTEKIGLIIGPGGKNIRAMQETFECKISIEDGGICTITGINSDKVKAAVEHIKSMTAEVELGTIYEGRVTAIKEFGAFVEILPGQEGLVHVSELSDEFIRAVTDVVRIGDMLKVKVIGIDDFGKVKLSRKAILIAERGGAPAPAGDAPAVEAPVADVRPERAERPDRGPRGGFGDRPDRPARADRPERMDRPERADRPERTDRPERADRPERTDRPERVDRPERTDRPERADRPERTDRPERADRPERTDRPERADRPERLDRPERADRPERLDRPERADRPERTDRPERADRPERLDRPERADRPERMDRPQRTDRPERTDRSAPERLDRPERSDRPARMDRPIRDGSEGGDRGDRGPRPDRFADRPVRSDRFGDRSDRPERTDRPVRTDRPERDDRMDRGPRPDRFADRPVRNDRPGDRPDRAERPERPEREDRGPRPDRFADRPPVRPERPAHSDRPERAFRDDRAPRDERAPRDDRGPRSERAPAPLDRSPRPDRAPMERTPRSDRSERAARGDRSNMPMAEFGDYEDDTPIEPVIAPKPVQDVGKLESIDNLLGDEPEDRGDRRRGGRRARR